MGLCIQAVIVRRKKIVSLAIQTASSESLKKTAGLHMLILIFAGRTYV